ncbi:helix-turn-helix transcriptional regulator [Microterricola viridarii]|uniref:DNA-binding protein n=2 Tax=Microterricola viridarii TaxID=412690 RepID=A0A109QWT0_9MICO|nr:helix-turn-helix transcriptional regulator [Microterricola viridarii]AMB58684.1 DNA-binding protein [Microterricola viridarii]SDS87792.1 putative transcriptional regulator [Microterricola viridarii]
MKNSLLALRQARGISQDDLGKLLGVSRQTIISIEKGRYAPSLALAFKIAEHFDTTIESIFTPE